MKDCPRISYTIWFTQRTGSTLLCRAIEETGVAGRPLELLHATEPEGLLEHFAADDLPGLLLKLWRTGSTPNGVFGLKHGPSEPQFSRLINLLRDGSGARDLNRVAVWERVFPNHRHIFMTRRNKVRLAVSWWRAIQSGEWHRTTQVPAVDHNLAHAYDYHAIDTLLSECVMREAGIQEFLDEGNIKPLTVAYEDRGREPIQVHAVMRAMSASAAR